MCKKYKNKWNVKEWNWRKWERVDYKSKAGAIKESKESAARRRQRTVTRTGRFSPVNSHVYLSLLTSPHSLSYLFDSQSTILFTIFINCYCYCLQQTAVRHVSVGISNQSPAKLKTKKVCNINLLYEKLNIA